MPTIPNPLARLRQMIIGDLPEPPHNPHTMVGGKPEWLENLQPVVGQLPIPKGPPVRINDPEGRLTGNYDYSVMHDVVSKAKMAGVDPLTALAMAGQETTFGRYGAGADNPLHLLHHTMSDYNPGGDTLAALDYFKKRSSQFPHDEELGIQAYNGLGKIQGGSEVAPGTPMYGGQTDLHGATDRPYGKMILKLREMLAQQPSIQGLIKK